MSLLDQAATQRDCTSDSSPSTVPLSQTNGGGGVGGGVKVVEDWLACGEILAAQMPSPSTWSPEKRLAGAVLASALVEVRDRRGEVGYARRLREDLQWIRSDDTEWPYSFVPLCQLFGLEPSYVRQVVDRWLREPPVVRVRRMQAPHRQAA
jgi:hypothetical protein